jgi:ABC-type uncharacterized transport system permease subunit
MPLFWLRAALICYGVGLVYSLALIARRREALARITMPALWLGATLHFVSLVESAVEFRRLAPSSASETESLLGFLVISFFLAVWVKYKALSPGVFIFPLVFLLTFVAGFGPPSSEFETPVLGRGWIFLHVALVFLGYAALALSGVASALYLVQERSLKSKRPGTLAGRMPPLEVIDEIGYRSLLFGFPFMTLGLIAGLAVAQRNFAGAWFFDPKVLLSLLAWALYMVLVYTRWTAGWRGRKAAMLSTFAFLAVMGAWAANYFSNMHRFLRP